MHMLSAHFFPVLEEGGTVLYTGFLDCFQSLCAFSGAAWDGSLGLTSQSSLLSFLGVSPLKVWPAFSADIQEAPGAFS